MHAVFAILISNHSQPNEPPAILNHKINRKHSECNEQQRSHEPQTWLLPNPFKSTRKSHEPQTGLLPNPSKLTNQHHVHRFLERWITKHAVYHLIRLIGSPIHLLLLPSLNPSMRGWTTKHRAPLISEIQRE